MGPRGGFEERGCWRHPPWPGSSPASPGAHSDVPPPSSPTPALISAPCAHASHSFPQPRLTLWQPDQGLRCPGTCLPLPHGPFPLPPAPQARAPPQKALCWPGGKGVLPLWEGAALLAPRAERSWGRSVGPAGCLVEGPAASLSNGLALLEGGSLCGDSRVEGESQWGLGRGQHSGARRAGPGWGPGWWPRLASVSAQVHWGLLAHPQPLPGRPQRRSSEQHWGGQWPAGQCPPQPLPPSLWAGQ